MAIYTGKAGGDSLSGGSEGDAISGLEGDDTLYGGKGNDTLTGGPGNDALDGGEGNDVAVLSGNFADYTVTFDSATHTYTLIDRVADRDGTDTVLNVESFQFADVAKTAAEMRNAAPTPDSTVTSPGNDSIVASGGGDSLNGAAGDDSLYGGKGDDTLNGGSGNDYLNGSLGVNTAVYSGNFSDYTISFQSEGCYVITDQVSGRDGTDSLDLMTYAQFADGVRILSDFAPPPPPPPPAPPANLVLTSTSASDLLVGGAGDDTLYGGKGMDTLVGGGGNDVLSGGYTAVFSGNFADYDISFDSGTSTYTIADRVGGRDGRDTAYGMVEFRFADGVRDSAMELLPSPVTSPGRDRINGTGSSDNLSGEGGNDSLYGSKGNDTLTGGAGNDFLDGGDDADTAVFSGNFADYTFTQDAATGLFTFVDGVSGRDGTDTLRAVEWFQFADGMRDASLRSSHTSPEDDSIRGSTGPDSLAGAAGNDWLYGSKGDDTLEGGSGNDTLDGDVGTDTAVFSGVASQYTISTIEEGLRYIVVDQVANRDGTDEVGLIEYLQFADGTWLASQLISRSGGTPPVDTPANPPVDGLPGTAAGDALAGTDRNETLSGADGNDTLDGGPGNDMLDGGAGIDVAVYEGNRSQYSIVHAGDGFTVAGNGGGGSTDTLLGVERLRFGDIRLALDLDGNAGDVAKALGVLFGPASVGNRAFVGIGLNLLDAGMSFEALLEFGLHAILGDNPDHGAVVDLLYTNVLGSALAPEVHDQFVALLEQGVHSQTSLALLAANHALNLANIHLTGLLSTGLEYA